uniref:Uncharacterized protein n=1 Tax=Takifugu rubripes TaxID=31033 RepID=A0A3B5KIY3_TAKRU
SQLLVTQVINSGDFFLVAVIMQNESSAAHCKRGIVFCFHCGACARAEERF